MGGDPAARAQTRQGRRGIRVGSVVGRYVVVGELADDRGALRFVAYDPELGRRVTLEVRGWLDDGAAQSRVHATRATTLEDARATASLDHEAIVRVHDVGEFDSVIWLAMEYIEGPSMVQWLEERTRGWREILEVITAAAKGLDAAHAHGLCYPDLECPDIVIARDGRPRLGGLGLRRAHDGERLTRDHERAPAGGGDPPCHAATASSAKIMTTDQDRLCAIAAAALFGAPIHGGSADPSSADPQRASRAFVRSTGRAPAWLRRIVERGVDPDPGRRFRSMRDLLAALERGRSTARVRGVAMALGALALLAGGVTGAAHVDHAMRVSSCARLGAEFVRDWDEAARERLREALVGTGLKYAATTADKLMPRLDAHARTLQTAAREVCERTQVTGEWDADLSERARWCLDQRRMEFDSLVETLGQGGAGAVESAVTAAAALPQISVCLELDSLAHDSPPTPEARDEVVTLHKALADVIALQHTGAYGPALDLARQTLARAQTHGSPRLAASARLAVGRLLEARGEYSQAEVEFEAAFFAAARSDAAELMVEAADGLAGIVCEVARPRDGLRWSRIAAAKLTRVPDPVGTRMAYHLSQLARPHAAMAAFDEALALRTRVLALRRAALGSDHPFLNNDLEHLANAHRAAGEIDESIALHLESLALREQTLGLVHPEVATNLHNLGVAYEAARRFDEATAVIERAREIWEETLGPDHPSLATCLDSLARMRHVAGKLEEARDLQQRALAIRRRALGDTHPAVAASLTNLAVVQIELGQTREAGESFRAALAIWEATLESDHPHLAVGLANVAAIEEMLGAYTKAEALYRRALALRERRFGAEHPIVASTINALANLLRLAGHLDEALALHERALAIRLEALGPEHPDVAESLLNRGDVQLALGSPATASDSYERALTILRARSGPHSADVGVVLVSAAKAASARGRTADAIAMAEDAAAFLRAGGGSPADIAKADFVLAQALWRTGQSGARALRLARASLEVLRASPDKAETALSLEVHAWLRARAAGK